MNVFRSCYKVISEETARTNAGRQLEARTCPKLITEQTRCWMLPCLNKLR